MIRQQGPAVSEADVPPEYAARAAEYDDRWSRYVRVSIGRTLPHVKAEAGSRILDIGCGTGQLLDALSRAFPRANLHGVDPAPRMLDLARSRLGARASLALAPASRLPFRTDRFDVAVSTSVFHRIIDGQAAVRELARVVRAGGCVVITDWSDDYLTCRIVTWFLRTFRGRSVRAYRVEECASLLRAGGFEVEHAERYRVGWIWGLMTIRAARNP